MSTAGGQKSLMILGAGIYQAPLIKTAKAMGLHTIVASIPGPYPGFALADEVLYVNTRDEDGVLAAARSHGIDGILTTGTDVAVRSIGRVCDELGLAGISYGAACKLGDKAVMKQTFKDGGVSTTDFAVVHDEQEAYSAAEHLGYPVMVKAPDVSGSRGITRVSDRAGLADALAHAQAASQADHWLVERVAAGTEIGLDAFVWNNEIVLCLPHTKYVYRWDGVTIPIGHGFPYPCPDETRNALTREVEHIVSATGANNCAINADVFVTEDGKISIIEAGGRCGATTIPELVALHTGVDYYREMIRAALGEEPSFAHGEERPCIGLLLHAPYDAVITSVDHAGIEALRNDDCDIRLDYGPGDRVYAMRDGTDRIGQLTLRTASLNEAQERADAILACMTFAQA